MIGRLDRAWIAVRKLRTRKRWVALSVFSLSLGLTIFVTTACLVTGFKASFEGLLLLELRDLPPDQIRVRPDTSVTHPRKIAREDVASLRAMPGVRSVSGQISIHPVRLDVGREPPGSPSAIVGMEEPFLERDLAPGHTVWEAAQRVPLIAGRDLLETAFDPKEKLFKIDPLSKAEHALGTDLDLWVGGVPPVWPYKTSWLGGKYHLERMTKDEIEQERSSRRRGRTGASDQTIGERALRLRAHIVGLHVGTTSLVPISVAREAASWIDCRDRLARHGFAPRAEPGPPGAPGEAAAGVEDPVARQEMSRLWLLLASAGDERDVFGRVRGMGLSPESRRSKIEEEQASMESAMELMQGIFLGIGLVIFGVACLFVATTTSKIIGDSRREIGVFRAVGATRWDVLSIFLLQSSLLGLAGALLGILQGIGLAEALSAWAIRSAHSNVPLESVLIDVHQLLPSSFVAYDGRAFFTAVLGAVIASVLAGLIPARRAAHLDPVEALRRVE